MEGLDVFIGLEGFPVIDKKYRGSSGILPTRNAQSTKAHKKRGIDSFPILTLRQPVKVTAFS
jgi:hypothetical protein